MVRQSAFEDGGRLKGALHCHTTRSDGQDNPADVIRAYKADGYDFIALTDHNIYNYENFAPETDITILPGMERDHKLSDEGIHVFHTVCLGPPRDQGNGYAQDQRFEGGKLVLDQYAYQPSLDDMHANGNLTLYCHPEWSGTPAREFDQLQGNFGMEIWNSGCALEHELDTNAAYWDELLMQGKRIWGVATDDGHDPSAYGLGWVCVRAENTVPAILRALKEGAFYASCGPTIHDFYIEDGIATLRCSPCAWAGFRYGHMPTKLTHAKPSPVTETAYKVPSYFTYIRGVVQDEQGRKAWTNPIFL